MDIDDENLSDFPDISRGAAKLLFLRLGSGVNFLQVFKSISLASTNMILLLCGTEIEGLTIMSEYQKCIQGSCHLPIRCFDQTNIPDRMVRMAISGVDLEQAISIMPNATIELSIVEEGEPLEVRMIDETGLEVQTVIQCFDHESVLDFNFDKTRTVARLVISSQIIKSALDNWDVIGMSTTITMKPENPKFSFKSSGIVGTVEIEFTDELLDLEAPFRCNKATSYKYQTSFIKNVIKACQYSTHISFRVDHQGVLQVQHLLIFNIADGNQENIFLTFFVTPEFDPDELDSSVSTFNSSMSTFISTAE